MIYADGGENMKLIMRQVNLMKCLNENPKASIRELGEILNVSVQTIKSDLQVIYMQSCYRRWKRVLVGSVFSDMVSGMPECSR